MKLSKAVTFVAKPINFQRIYNQLLMISQLVFQEQRVLVLQYVGQNLWCNRMDPHGTIYQGSDTSVLAAQL